MFLLVCFFVAKVIQKVIPGHSRPLKAIPAFSIFNENPAVCLRSRPLPLFLHLVSNSCSKTLQAFQNIENVLKAKDMGLEDLVETRTYIISINDLSGYREGRAAAFKHCQVYPKPTVALLVVNSLAQAHWKIEICATAAKL